MVSLVAKRVRRSSLFWWVGAQNLAVEMPATGYVAAARRPSGGLETAVEPYSKIGEKGLVALQGNQATGAKTPRGR